MLAAWSTDAPRGTQERGILGIIQIPLCKEFAAPSRPIAHHTLDVCAIKVSRAQFQGPEAQLYQEPLEMKIKSQQNCKDSWDSYQISSVKTKLCLKADSSFCDVKIKRTTKKPNQPRGILAGLEESSLLVLVNGRNPLANQLLCR